MKEVSKGSIPPLITFQLQNPKLIENANVLSDKFLQNKQPRILFGEPLQADFSILDESPVCKIDEIDFDKIKLEDEIVPST